MNTNMNTLGLESMVFCIVNFQKLQDKPFSRNIWNFNHGNYDVFTKELEMMPWHIVGNFDIEEWAELWTSEFLKIAQNNIPQWQLKFIIKTSILTKRKC